MLPAVAIACGFETRGAFTRAFRRKYGKTPSAHRHAGAP
ncbi:helix-turn-helix domain-containing protein [Leisingera sp. ANG-M1]